MKFNNKLFYSFFSICILLGSSSVNSQTIKQGTKIMKVPSWAKTPYGDISVVEPPSKNENEDWVVYSDRLNNYSILKPGDLKAHKLLNYGDAFIVIEEKGEYIHLIKWERDIVGTKSRTPKTIRPTDDYGWVKKKNVLCWKYSLKTEGTDFTVKAISIINDESDNVIKNISKYVNKNQQIQLFNDPDLTVKNSNDIKFFNFLFVFKEEKNAKGEKSYLIGRTDLTSPGTFSEQILGWVSEKLIFKWENRLCIEPNSNLEAIKERKSKGVVASMFVKKDEAEQYSNGIDVNPDQKVDNYEKPLVSNQLRNPVLGFSGNLYSTGFQTAILDKSGVEQADVSQAANVRKLYNDLRASTRKYNFIFVLSGNEVIRSSYYENIIRSIESIYSFYSTEENDIKKANFGVVIYGGNSECEPLKKDISSSYSDITDWIREKQTYPMCKSKDNSEDILSGIETAYRMLSGHKNEVNVIINVGVAANSSNVSVETYNSLAKRLAEYKCAMITMLPQYYPNTSSLNNVFLSKSKDFILEMCKEASININKTNEGDLTTKGVKITIPSWKTEDDDNYYFDYPNKSPLAAAILSAPMSSQLKSEEIIKGILKIIETVDEANDQALSVLATKCEGVGKNVVKFNPLVLSMYASLKDMQMKATSEDASVLMKLMNDDNFQLFIKAYTSTKNDKLSYPLFNHTIFVTGSEYDELSSIFEKFQTSTSSSTKRDQMMSTFKSIITSYYGSEARSAMQTASIAQIMQRLTGLPTSSEMLKNTRISDIPDMSDAAFVKLEEQLIKRIKKFKTIKEMTRLRMETGDRVFYWVPEEYLP